MQGMRTNDGLEFLLRPRGFARYPAIAFLTVWLCGWLVGEAFALWFLGAGAAALLSGTPPGPGRALLTAGPTLAAGIFLFFWLALWTLGGYVAARHLLQLLWSSDRIVAGAGVLRAIRRLGPFRSTLEIPRDTLRRVYLVDGTRTIMAETDAGPIVVSALGTPAEREAVARALREELRVPEERSGGEAAPSLPESWEEIITPEGEPALVARLDVRRRQARVAVVAASALAIVAAFVVRDAVRNPEEIGLAAMVGVAAAGAIWGADRLRRGRYEWRIGDGTVTCRWRHGARVRDLFAGSRLELTRRSDGDGDPWFTLAAVAEGVPDVPPASRASTGRRDVARALRDPAVPRRLGRWLADRARIPLEDKTTAQALSVDRERALAQLRASGPLGRRVAGWIERLDNRRGGGQPTT